MKVFGISSTSHGSRRRRSGYLLYLDALRETDVKCSIDVAGLFLEAEMEATRREATDLLKHWAQTFSARRPRP